MTHSLFPQLCSNLHCREERCSPFMGNYDSATQLPLFIPPHSPFFFIIKKKKHPLLYKLQLGSLPFFRPISVMSFSQKSCVHTSLMSLCRVSSPSLPQGHVAVFLEWPLGNDKESRGIEEFYLQNVVTRVIEAKHHGTLAGLMQTGTFSLLYFFVSIQSHNPISQ